MAELEGNNVNVTSMGPNGWWDVPMYNEQCGFTTGQYHPPYFLSPLFSHAVTTLFSTLPISPMRMRILISAGFRRSKRYLWIGGYDKCCFLRGGGNEG